MISKDQIRTALQQVADNSGLVGESTNLLINELTYALYHQQSQITNTLQENNLSTARLLNSKIRHCMNVMYSVYRGKNARVRLTFKNVTTINKNKFDVIYTSNTFKVFAENSIRLTPTNNDSTITIDGILCTKDPYEATIQVTNDNRYYIDFIIDNNIISNISQDVMVFINGTEYPITRNFFDHINQSVPLQDYDAYKIGESIYYVMGTQWVDLSMSDTELSELKIKGNLEDITELPELPCTELDEIFILTIPDYGIRLYKRGYFNESDEVTIKAFQYTTMDDINSDEFNKILIPGTSLVSKLDKNNIITGKTKKSILNGIIPEVARDTERSLMYSANFYSRLQGQILSKSDINMLFNEYFIDKIQSSINWFRESDENPGSFKDGEVMIYYVPKVQDEVIGDEEMAGFRAKYGSYFISNNLRQYSGRRIEIDVNIILYMKQSVELSTEIESIFSNYEYKLNDPTDTSVNLLKPKQIFADISKLNDVDYVDEIKYTQAIDTYTDDDVLDRYGMPPTFIEDEDGLLVPTFYVFNLEIVYKSEYETLS